MPAADGSFQLFVHSKTNLKMSISSNYIRLASRALDIDGSQTTPILIAVLGVTGAGKTTFISKATGRNDLKIGSGLKSCTANNLRRDLY